MGKLRHRDGCLLVCYGPRLKCCGVGTTPKFHLVLQVLALCYAAQPLQEEHRGHLDT